MRRKLVCWSAAVVGTIGVLLIVCRSSDTGELGSKVCAPLPRCYLDAVPPEDWWYYAKEGGRFGWVTTEGRWVVPPEFDFAQPLVKTGAGFAVSGGVAFLVSRDGSRVPLAVPGGGRIEDLGLFADGLVPVKVEGQWRYVRADGRLAIPYAYDAASRFRGGVAKVGRLVQGLRDWLLGALDYEYCFIDVEGAVVASSDPRVHLFLSGGEELRPLQANSGNWGFVDSEGRYAIAPSFRAAKQFNNGLASVKTTVGYQYIDPTGAVVIRGPFHDANTFSEELAAVQMSEGGRWGYIDPSGEFVIPPRFLSGRSFQGGRVEVVIPWRGYAYIDRSGAVVWPRDDSSLFDGPTTRPRGPDSPSPSNGPTTRPRR